MPSKVRNQRLLFQEEYVKEENSGPRAYARQ